MNTALTKATDPVKALAAIPALLVPPRLSGSLAHQLDVVADDASYASHGSPGVRDVAEARNRLPELDHLCELPDLENRADRALIWTWCERLTPHLAKPPNPGPELIRAVFEGIAPACRDLPRSVWTTESLEEALRVLSWWPTPAKVREILLPFAGRLWRLRSGLRAVIDRAERTAPPPAPLTDPTPEAEAHVAQVVAAFTAERSWNQPGTLAAPKPPTAPRHLSDGALLAAHEAEAAAGGLNASASRTRADMLRAKIGRPVGARV